jgi:hypothetical protein
MWVEIAEGAVRMGEIKNGRVIMSELERKRSLRVSLLCIDGRIMLK